MTSLDENPPILTETGVSATQFPIEDPVDNVTDVPLVEESWSVLDGLLIDHAGVSLHVSPAPQLVLTVSVID